MAARGSTGVRYRCGAAFAAGGGLGRLARLFVLAAMPSLIGGCGLSQWIDNGFKLGPRYSPPTTSVADEWIDRDAPGVLAQPPRYDSWWSVFDDPVLNDLIKTAHRQNLTLREAGFRVLGARAQRAIAVGNLFPQTQQAFGEFERIWESRNTAAAAPLRSLDQWTTGFNLSWELDIWGRFRRAIESADASLEASVFQYDAILVSLIAEVATAYVDIRVFQQRLRYARANVETQRRSLALTEARAQAGKTDDVGVHLSRSNLATTEASIPPLEAGLRQANNRLCTLLGRPPTDLIETLGDERGVPSAPAEISIGIPADLVRRRPDVRAAERAVAAQSAQIGIAASDLYPSIAVTGEVFVQSGQFPKLFNADSIAGSVGPSFRWDILNYGRLVNNLRAQEAGFNELVAQYQNTVLEANQEVEDQLTAFLNATEQVRFLASGVEQTKAALELLLIQYTEGEIDFSPVFILQTSVTQLDDQLAVARGSIAAGLIGVYKALGGGWEIRTLTPGPPQAAPPPLHDLPQASSRPSPAASFDRRP